MRDRTDGKEGAAGMLCCRADGGLFGEGSVLVKPPQRPCLHQLWPAAVLCMVVLQWRLLAAMHVDKVD
jgi:hypothetical protein